MFKELRELGQHLEREGQLPPPGFYFYKEPIKWVIHFYPDEPLRSTIRQAAIDKLPRPYSGRTAALKRILWLMRQLMSSGLTPVKEKRSTQQRSTLNFSNC